jgi:hypothetical protein
MFRRSTSPPPPPSCSSSSSTASHQPQSSSSSSSHNDKLFNDWKRRFQQKTKLKLGLTSDIKDSVTGNLESRIERYRTISQKLLSMKTQCEIFCQKFRLFLSLENDMSTFLPETFLSKFYEDIHHQHLSNVVEMMLINEIELPIFFLSHKSEEIEQLHKHRTGGLYDQPDQLII